MFLNILTIFYLKQRLFYKDFLKENVIGYLEFYRPIFVLINTFFYRFFFINLVCQDEYCLLNDKNNHELPIPCSRIYFFMRKFSSNLVFG